MVQEVCAKINVAGGYGINKSNPVPASSSLPTCAEKQKDLHGEELVVG